MLRLRQQRNLLVTLMLSQGVPMITSGDEMGKTQGGNNNAFVQDNATSWIDWELDEPRGELLAFSRELLAFRQRHPVFRRSRFLKGQRVEGSELKDVAWFAPTGLEMKTEDWASPNACVVGLLLAGDALDWRDAMGEPVIDDSFLMLLNGARHDVQLTLPPAAWGVRWAIRLDTRFSRLSQEPELAAGTTITLLRNSAMVLKRVTPGRGSLRPSRVVSNVGEF